MNDSGMCRNSTAHQDGAGNESEAPSGNQGECVDCGTEAHCVTCIGPILPPLATQQTPTKTTAIWPLELSPAPREADPNLPKRPPRG